LAFLDGFSTSLTVGAIVAVIAAAGALLVRKGENTGGAVVV
jgi:hypothetical protein